MHSLRREIARAAPTVTICGALGAGVAAIVARTLDATRDDWWLVGLMLGGAVATLILERRLREPAERTESFARYQTLVFLALASLFAGSRVAGPVGLVLLAAAPLLAFWAYLGRRRAHRRDAARIAALEKQLASSPGSRRRHRDRPI